MRIGTCVSTLCSLASCVLFSFLESQSPTDSRFEYPQLHQLLSCRLEYPLGLQFFPHRRTSLSMQLILHLEECFGLRRVGRGLIKDRFFSSLFPQLTFARAHAYHIEGGMQSVYGKFFSTFSERPYYFFVIV